MISLESIRKQAELKPPRIVLYGTQGVGKTTFAYASPDPIFILCEDGLGELTDAQHWPKMKSYQEVIEAITALSTGDHGFQTCVIDTLDALEPMLWAHVAQMNGKKSIEDFGYGKGYTLALSEGLNLLAGLDYLRDTKGMSTILLAHSKVARINAPDVGEFDKFAMRLHDKLEAAIRGWADCVLFFNYKTSLTSMGNDTDRKRAIGSGDRVIHTCERPAWYAKSRYSLPAEILVPNATDPQAKRVAAWNAFMAAFGASQAARAVPASV